MNYYNENDPKAAAWLRELIKAKEISAGEVDERSIEDVTATSLVGYTQHHFFAGIGGWSYALKLAGWPDTEPVWTGSCPCQPFSSAGKRKGATDERHLWPAWHWLIAQYRPDVVFGEQVASKDGLKWLDLVSTDLENSNYAVGSIVYPAAFKAPHRRERIWFVADSKTRRRSPRRTSQEGTWSIESDRPCAARELAHPESDRRLERRTESNWGSVEWCRCSDGKYRPIEPGVFPLAHGVSHRVGILRGYGNAIVPQAAAQVIRAYRELGV